MLRVITLKQGKYIVETETEILNVLQIEGNSWLTKDEISLLFKRNKGEIKSELHTLITDSNFELTSKIKRIYNSDMLKYDTYYSLDIILLLGYKMKEFEKTKLLTQIHRSLKNYIRKVEYSPLTKYKQKIISQLSQFLYNMNRDVIA